MCQVPTGNAYLHAQDVSRQQHLCSGVKNILVALVAVVKVAQVPKGSQLPAMAASKVSTKSARRNMKVATGGRLMVHNTYMRHVFQDVGDFPAKLVSPPDGLQATGRQSGRQIQCAKRCPPRRPEFLT